MDKNTSKKFRRIFLLPVLCAAGLTLAGCATPALWAESETPADYFNLESHPAPRIYIDRQNDNSPQFGVTYRLDVTEKKMKFPPSETGLVVIRPGRNDKAHRYEAVVTLLDGRAGIRPESVRVHVKSENENPKARFDIEFELPEIEVHFEEYENIRSDGAIKPSFREFFGASRREVYLLPLLVEKAWQKKFGEEINSYNMMRPAAWLDKNGNVARDHREGGYPGLLLAVRPNRFNVKYVRISENIMKFKGLKDIPIDYRGNFAKISAPVRDVKIVTEKYEMSRWNALNDLSAKAVFDATAIDVKYKYPLALRLIGTPFTLYFDSAVAIIAAPLILIAYPLSFVAFFVVY